METIEINGHKWLKGKGDEGQDVYIAQFIVEDDDVISPGDELLGDDAADVPGAASDQDVHLRTPRRG